MKERIFQILNKTGFTATKLADELKIQRSGISHILSGRNQPSYDLIVKILTRFKEINAEWLILGTGNMYKNENISSEIKSNNHLINNKPEQTDLFTKITSKMENSEQKESTSGVTDVNIKNIILLNSNGTFEIYNQLK